jgi:hypothetical protein
MTDDTLLPFDLPAVHRKKLTVDFEGGNQSSDAGLLLLREAERKLGVCRRLAEAMPDRRDPDRVRHAMFEMVMARSSAIACGHKDANDLDRLRHDPLMKITVGRCPQQRTCTSNPRSVPGTPRPAACPPRGVASTGVCLERRALFGARLILMGEALRCGCDLKPGRYEEPRLLSRFFPA